jgi:hypothetical protein
VASRAQVIEAPARHHSAITNKHDALEPEALLEIAHHIVDCVAAGRTGDPLNWNPHKAGIEQQIEGEPLATFPDSKNPALRSESGVPVGVQRLGGLVEGSRTRVVISH